MNKLFDSLDESVNDWDCGRIAIQTAKLIERIFRMDK